jgi:hypothetical protein
MPSIRARFLRKRYVIPSVATVVALAGSGVAYAFFSAGGTGTGSAQVGDASNFVITQTGINANLYPDASVGSGPNIATVSFSVTNSGKGDENLDSLTISVANSDGSPWSSQTDPTKPACDASDFSIGGDAQPGTSFIDTDASLAGTFTGGQSKNSSVTLEMVDNGLNQDNCQGITVPLYFAANLPTPVANADLSLDTPPPSGSGGWYPNPTFAPVPSVTVGETDVNLVATAIQPNAENPDGTFTLTYDNTFLTFTGTTSDGTCTAVSSIEESCSFTDLSHGDSSKQFDFTPLKAGDTSVSVTVSITGSGTATETFPLSITN